MAEESPAFSAIEPGIIVLRNPAGSILHFEITPADTKTMRYSCKAPWSCQREGNKTWHACIERCL
jgi:hypothetical protein